LAGDVEDLRGERDALRRRVEALEEIVAQLRQRYAGDREGRDIFRKNPSFM
jgi:hypothetical protein